MMEVGPLYVAFAFSSSSNTKRGGPSCSALSRQELAAAGSTEMAADLPGPDVVRNVQGHLFKAVTGVQRLTLNWSAFFASLRGQPQPQALGTFMLTTRSQEASDRGS